MTVIKIAISLAPGFLPGDYRSSPDETVETVSGLADHLIHLAEARC